MIDHESRTSSSSGPAALAGVRVIDFTHAQAGPACSQALAFLGAEVIHLERPGVGEGRPLGWLVGYNTNKKSVTLNVKSPEGKRLFRELIKGADVLVENFAPGTMERLGLDYETMHELNPRLIYAEIKAFAAGSPYESYPGYDPIAQATAGIMSLTGYPDRAPLRPSVDVADYGSGMMMAMGVLAALFQRETTGEGQHVKVAMQDVAIGFARRNFNEDFTSHTPLERPGNGMLGRHRQLKEPYHLSRAFHCKPFGPNDYCYVHLIGDAKWDALLHLMGRDDLVGDSRFSTTRARVYNADEVDELVDVWISQLTKYEAMERLADVRIAAAAVLAEEEVLADPTLRDREMLVPMSHPELGEFGLIGWPVQMSASHTVVTSGPHPGEHNDEILGDELGLSLDELADLRASGVI